MIAILIILAVIGIAVGIGLIINNKLAKEKERNGYSGSTVLPKLPTPLIVISTIALVLLTLIVKIDAQEIGVVVTPSGVKETELTTGWHLVWWWNSVHKMDKTVWVYTCAKASKEGQKPNADEIWTPTKDGIKMGFDVSVSWRINPEEGAWIYQNVTENDGGQSGRYLWLEENVLRPKLKSAMAITISEYTPIEVYSTKREEIAQKVYKRIQKEIAQYKKLIDNVDLREVYYNQDYEKAIQSKKLAEQEALRLIEVTKQKTEQLTQAKIDKDIKIQQAQGEAEALRITGQSIAANPLVVQMEWIKAWQAGGSKVPTYLTSPGGGQMFMMNIGK
jgi:regulator of protease activity HflC (stomatin/prohibitin superfamily)